MLYCLECGKKTFQETGDVDYEAGDEYVCLSCGCRSYLSMVSRAKVTVEPCGEYAPVMGITESILNRFVVDKLMEALADMWEIPDPPILSGQGAGTIRFRRYNEAQDEKKID